MRKPEFIARQGRKPSGFLGEIVARIMAVETREMNMRGIEMCEIEDGQSVLDIGCGHGVALSEISRRLPTTRLTGVDFSEVMLRVAAKRNRHLLESLRLTLISADSSQLPLPDQSFDRALSVHTIYFWSNPLQHIGEVFRVLGVNGRLIVGYRPLEDERALATYSDKVYRFPSTLEVENWFSIVGFEAVATVTSDHNGVLMCWTIGHKS